MEKSKSFPHYTSSSSGGEFVFRDRLDDSYFFNGTTERGGGFAASVDPELKRKRRIASYNGYSMDSTLKSRLKHSLKWIKSKFTL